MPRRTRAWHAAIMLMAAVLLVSGSAILRRSAGGAPVRTEPFTSLINDDLECLFIGTSHVGYGIDPRLYSMRSINLTAGAMNYECMEILLAKYLDHASDLRLLVLEAGIVPLRVDTMARLDGDYRSLYRIGFSTFDLPLNPYKLCVQWLKESWLFYPIYYLDRWSPSLLVWGTRPLGGEGEGNVETRGFTPLDRIMSDKNDGKVVVEHHRLDHLRVDHSRANLPALLRIVKMTEARGIPVLFLRMPHHRSYIENRPPEWEAQYNDMVEAVTSAAGAGTLHYLDWESVMASEDTLFADGDHLNQEGVRELRDKLDPVLRGFSRP